MEGLVILLSHGCEAALAWRVAGHAKGGARQLTVSFREAELVE